MDLERKPEWGDGRGWGVRRRVARSCNVGEVGSGVSVRAAKPW